jgi:hypothetical protein
MSRYFPWKNFFPDLCKIVFIYTVGIWLRLEQCYQVWMKSSCGNNSLYMCSDLLIEISLCALIFSSPGRLSVELLSWPRYRRQRRHTCQLSRFQRDFPDFNHPSRFPDRDFQNPPFSQFSKSISRFMTIYHEYCQLKVKISRHFVTAANRNRDEQSPLLHVYLKQHVETIWTSIIIWGQLTFVEAFIE